MRSQFNIFVNVKILLLGKLKLAVDSRIALLYRLQSVNRRTEPDASDIKENETAMIC